MDRLVRRILTVSLRAEARRLLVLAAEGRKAGRSTEAFWQAAERASRVLWRLSGDPKLGRSWPPADERGTRLVRPADLVEAVQVEGLREAAREAPGGDEES